MTTRAPWTEPWQPFTSEVRPQGGGDRTHTPGRSGTTASAGAPSRPGLAPWACGRRPAVRIDPLPATGVMPGIACRSGARGGCGWPGRDNGPACSLGAGGWHGERPTCGGSSAQPFSAGLRGVRTNR
jgi:hypothetical protein